MEIVFFLTSVLGLVGVIYAFNEGMDPRPSSKHIKDSWSFGFVIIFGMLSVVSFVCIINTVVEYDRLLQKINNQTITEIETE